MKPNRSSAGRIVATNIGDATMRKSQVAAVGALLCVTGTVLSGCAAIEQQMPIVALFDTGPQPPNISLRQERLLEVPRYRPVRSCTYNAGYGPQKSTQSISVQSVRDRLLVTSDDNAGGRSTALISGNGHRYSFNVVGRNGAHISSDRWAGQASADGGPVMNNMDLFMPEYIPGQKDLGDVISFINDSRGSPRAAFVYMGAGIYQGREVLLLKLVMNPTSIRPDLSHSVGFSLVDRSRGLSIMLSVFRSPNIRLTLQGCSD